MRQTHLTHQNMKFFGVSLTLFEVFDSFVQAWVAAFAFCAWVTIIFFTSLRSWFRFDGFFFVKFSRKIGHGRWKTSGSLARVYYPVVWSNKGWTQSPGLYKLWISLAHRLCRLVTKQVCLWKLKEGKNVNHLKVVYPIVFVSNIFQYFPKKYGPICKN